MREKQILLDNAYCAWANAIHYCRLIKVGRATLHNKKAFVSSFHNSVELFLKQIMLDENDHRVANIKKVAKDGKPAKEFYESDNLNTFFEELPQEEMQKFYSIEFSKLIELFRKDFRTFEEKFGTSILPGLQSLNDLRNQETHFLINSKSFLVDTEFTLLFNAMDAFNNFLHDRELLPYDTFPTGEHQRLFFASDILTDFSYVDRIKKSAFVQKVVQEANGLEVGILDLYPYALAERIIENVNPKYADSFDELWEYLEVMNDLDLLDVDCKYERIDDKNQKLIGLYLRFEI